MAGDPVPRNEFLAEIRRLDQADDFRRARLEAHIADYRREASAMQLNINDMDSKLDVLIDNQARIKGRDGVILVLIGMFVSVMTTAARALRFGRITIETRP